MEPTPTSDQLRQAAKDIAARVKELLGSPNKSEIIVACVSNVIKACKVFVHLSTSLADGTESEAAVEENNKAIASANASLIRDVKNYAATYDQEKTGIVTNPSSGVLKERINETATEVATKYVKCVINVLAPSSSKARSNTVMINTTLGSPASNNTTPVRPTPIATHGNLEGTSEPTTASPSSPVSNMPESVEEWTPRSPAYVSYHQQLTSKLSDLIAAWGKGTAQDDLLRCTTETAAFVKKIIEETQGVLAAFEAYMKLCKASGSAGDATNKLVGLSNSTKELVTLVKFRVNAPNADQPNQSVQEIITCSVSLTRACKALITAIEGLDARAVQVYNDIIKRRQSIGALNARSRAQTAAQLQADAQAERQKLNEQIGKVMTDLRGLVSRVQSKEKAMRSERRVHIAARYERMHKIGMRLDEQYNELLRRSGLLEKQHDLIVQTLSDMLKDKALVNNAESVATLQTVKETLTSEGDGFKAYNDSFSRTLAMIEELPAKREVINKKSEQLETSIVEGSKVFEDKEGERSQKFQEDIGEKLRLGTLKSPLLVEMVRQYRVDSQSKITEHIDACAAVIKEIEALEQEENSILTQQHTLLTSATGYMTGEIQRQRANIEVIRKFTQIIAGIKSRVLASPTAVEQQPQPAQEPKTSPKIAPVVQETVTNDQLHVMDPKITDDLKDLSEETAVNAQVAASAAQGSTSRARWVKKSKKKFIRLENMPLSGGIPDQCRPVYRYPLESLVGLVGTGDAEEIDKRIDMQREMSQVREQIIAESKKNYQLVKDLHELDKRIAMMIRQRLSLDEVSSFANEIDDTVVESSIMVRERKMGLYSNLFFLLRTKPKYVADLIPFVSLKLIDDVLRVVLFTLFGNQFDTREEDMLLDIFNLVIQKEISQVSDLGPFMRANSCLSRMLTTYTRRGPGQDYLKRILTDCLCAMGKIEVSDTYLGTSAFLVAGKDDIPIGIGLRNIRLPVDELARLGEMDLEINPLKIWKEMGRDEAEYETVCAAPEVQELLKPRREALLLLTRCFADVMIASVDEVPYGIRWLCKHILLAVSQRFPETDDFQKASLVGGYYLLRFVNPAIITPTASVLPNERLPLQLKKSLVYVAKLLQNVSNKPNLQKEPYMAEITTEFLDKYASKMNQFMFKLSECGERNEDAARLILLARTDSTVDITFNEIYMMHSVLLENKAHVVADDKDHLAVTLTDLGSAPDQVPRSCDKSISLPLVSRWVEDLDTIDTHQSMVMAVNEDVMGSYDVALMAETKNLCIACLGPALLAHKSIPIDDKFSFKFIVETNEFHLLDLLKHQAKASNDTELVAEYNECIKNVVHLESQGMTKASDYYMSLALDIVKDAVLLHTLYESLPTELSSVKNALASIDNDKLRDQLVAYKEYLRNVIEDDITKGESKRIQTQKKLGRSYTITGAASTPDDENTTGLLLHSRIIDRKILVDCSMPKDNHPNLYHVFKSVSDNDFTYSLRARSQAKPIIEFKLSLPDLISQRDGGALLFDHGIVVFDVKKLIEFLTILQQSNTF